MENNCKYIGDCDNNCLTHCLKKTINDALFPPTMENTIEQEQTFLDYIKSARRKFAKFINSLEWNRDLRTEVDDIMIAYDQMKHKIEEYELANSQISHHLDKLTEEIKDNANVWYHSRDFKVGSKAPIVREKNMVSEIDKESITKITAEYKLKNKLT